MGLVGSRVSAERAHDVLQELVPDELVYSFHVNMVVHGQETCLRDLCASEVVSLGAEFPGVGGWIVGPSR